MWKSSINKSFMELFGLAGAGGFEPPNTGIKSRRLNRLATPHLYANPAQHKSLRRASQALPSVAGGGVEGGAEMADEFLAIGFIVSDREIQLGAHRVEEDTAPEQLQH